MEENKAEAPHVSHVKRGIKLDITVGDLPCLVFAVDYFKEYLTAGMGIETFDIPGTLQLIRDCERWTRLLKQKLDESRNPIDNQRQAIIDAHIEDVIAKGDKRTLYEIGKEAMDIAVEKMKEGG